jgi:hypothetical protein
LIRPVHGFPGVAKRGLLVLLAGIVPAIAHAQTTGASVGDGMQLGPLTLQPRVALSNVGIDTNVRNTSLAPTRDFTLTFIPALDSRLRMRRASLRSLTSLEMLYFAKTKDQRSTSLSQTVRFEAGLAHLVPFVETGQTTTNQRVNVEIDERVRQTARGIKIGATVLAGSRTRITLNGERSRTEFGDHQDAASAAVENSIADALDRHSNIVHADVATDVTPLTTLLFTVDRLSDRFDKSSFRDNTSTRVMGGVEFKPLALISGRAAVGLESRTFDNGTATASELDFSGVVASADLRYVIRDSTAITLAGRRGIDYSVSDEQAYFVTLTGEISVTQAIGRRWDTVGRFGRTVLDYRNGAAVVVPAAERRDRWRQAGIGIGFRLREDTRIGVDATHVKRTSVIPERQYSGLRVGGSFSYAY